MLLAAVVFGALLLYGDLQGLTQGLATYDYGYFAIALLLATSNYVIRFWRWRYYLRVVDIHLPTLESALVFVAGFVMSVTPGKLGEVFKSLLLQQSRAIPIARSAPIVLAERLTDLTALVVLVAVGSMAFRGGIVVAFSGAAVALAIWIVCAFRPVGDLVLRQMARVRRLRSVTERLAEARESLFELVVPRRLAYGSALALFSWSLECVAMWWVIRGFEGLSEAPPLGLLEATFAYAAPTVAGAIALLPGGLGVTEAGMTATLELLGGASVTRAVASGTTLLIRLATLWWAVLLGLGAFLAWKRFVSRRPPIDSNAPVGND